MAYQHILTYRTHGRSLIEITPDIQKSIRNVKCESGLCHLFIFHTSASLIICENADPQVTKDLEAFMEKLVPDGSPLFRHTAEGPDDMPAHIRTTLTQSSLTIPIQKNELLLGTWQGIFLWEHRLSSFKRKIVLTVLD